MDELIQELTHIGFTEYDARVYIALLGDHPASGYQISKASGVPRSMAYASLARLASRGAVLKSTGEKATTYRPLPPDVLLAQLHQEHESRIVKLGEGLSLLYADKPEQALWSIEGRRSVLAFAQEMIQSTNHELMLVMPDRDIPDLEAQLRQAHGRGIQVNVLLTGQATLGFGQVAYHPPPESELQQLTDTLVIVVDGSEAMIASGDEKLSATITNNPQLVLITHQFIWMELFAQRVYARIGSELLERLDPVDRRVLEMYANAEGGRKV
jgi:Cd2+/Zn2+-exporting ATPase